MSINAVYIQQFSGLEISRRGLSKGWGSAKQPAILLDKNHPNGRKANNFFFLRSYCITREAKSPPEVEITTQHSLHSKLRCHQGTALKVYVHHWPNYVPRAKSAEFFAVVCSCVCPPSSHRSASHFTHLQISPRRWSRATCHLFFHLLEAEFNDSVCKTEVSACIITAVVTRVSFMTTFA